jgi:hypothetical protein
MVPDSQGGLQYIRHLFKIHHNTPEDKRRDGDLLLALWRGFNGDWRMRLKDVCQKMADGGENDEA